MGRGRGLGFVQGSRGRAHKYLHVCTCAYVKYICTYIHTYIHTYLHTYIHACFSKGLVKSSDSSNRLWAGV